MHHRRARWTAPPSASIADRSTSSAACSCPLATGSRSFLQRPGRITPSPASIASIHIAGPHPRPDRRLVGRERPPSACLLIELVISGSSCASGGGAADTGALRTEWLRRCRSPVAPSCRESATSRIRSHRLGRLAIAASVQLAVVNRVLGRREARMFELKSGSTIG